MGNGFKIFLVFILLVLAILAIIYFPLWNIWAVNTLFGLTIPWTFKTWLASLLITSMFTGASFRRKN